MYTKLNEKIVLYNYYDLNNLKIFFKNIIMIFILINCMAFFIFGLHKCMLFLNIF